MWLPEDLENTPFNSFSRSLEHFFLAVGQNNFGNKIPQFVIYFSFLAFT